MKKKYFFLYIQAGGGHISTAKAIARYMDKHYSSAIDPVLIDGFTEAPGWLKNIIIDGYKKSQTTGQRVYEFLYRCNKRRFIAKICQVILSRLLQGYIKRLIIKERPDHIVILHFFLVRPTVHMIKKLKLDIPVTTIITDPFTIHKLRSLDKKMNYVVFSDQAKDRIVKRGVASEQVKICPVILKEEFSHPLSSEKVREKKKELGLSSEKKVIFIMGAGDGMPKGEKIVQEIIDTKINAQIMIVCGKNQKLFRDTQAIAHQHPEYMIKIFGFVDFMYDLVNVADIIITKGGPATLMEILMMNKIPVINSYIWEQEKGNVDFIVHNNVGFYQPNIKKMVKIVDEMLQSDLSVYHQNIQKLQLKNGTQEVVEYLMERV
ncbi:MAG: glycosyltransferase [Candidatus Absconditabacterales bacterium]